jgi:hypothetical protein
MFFMIALNACGGKGFTGRMRVMTSRFASACNDVAA